MPKIVEITIPPGQTDQIVSEIQQIEELIGLRLHKGVSVQPPGDVVTVEVSNRHHPQLLHILDRHDIGSASGNAVTTSMPLSIVSATANQTIVKDSSDSSWEEMELMIARQSNMTINGMLLMGVSGFVAACSVATGSLHGVIGAMLIAPGFEPLVRIPLGLVSGCRDSLRRGLVDSAQAYAVVILAAMLATVFLLLLGEHPFSGDSAYLPKEALVAYWTTLTATSILVSAAAAIAGAVLIATNRSVLTTGVMIALALVPSIAIAGMAMVAGDLALAGKGLLRWIVDVALVIVVSMLVFAWKQTHLHKRRMLL